MAFSAGSPQRAAYSGSDQTKIFFVGIQLAEISNSLFKPYSQKFHAVKIDNCKLITSFYFLYQCVTWGVIEMVNSVLVQFGPGKVNPLCKNISAINYLMVQNGPKVEIGFEIQ